MRIDIPSAADKIITRLELSGFSAYIVGGCVRDMIMGRQSHDWDITTSADPLQIKEALNDAHIVETGIAHGTLTVILDGDSFEVTTFRSDGQYSDHRHPDKVLFSQSIQDDLARRDFTVNAMAYNHAAGLIDIFGGLSDIEHKMIRAVGNAQKRFSEDALRILRALRFSSTLGFDIDSETATAIKLLKETLSFVARERIYSELCKMIIGKNVLNVLKEYNDTVACAVPVIKPSIGFIQHNENHIYDVWEHTVRALAASPYDKITRLSVLLHDLGKPSCFSVDKNGTGHFYSHEQKSAEFAKSFFEHSGESKSIRERVEKLVKYHGVNIPLEEKAIKRWLRRMGEQDLLRLIDIKEADCLAQSEMCRSRLGEYDILRKQIIDIASADPCIDRSSLYIDGNDLIALGCSGRIIGRILDILLNEVIDGKCENTKDALIRCAIQLVDKQNEL